MKFTHNLLVDDPHITSRAQYVALIRHYRELDPAPWTRWAEYRDKVIKAVLAVEPVITCEYCGLRDLIPDIGAKGRHPKMVTIDHLIPKHRGGSNDLDNLVLSCSPCNSRKGDNLPTASQRACRRVSDIVGFTAFKH